MMVHLDNGLRFVANFKYEVKTNITKDPRHDFKHLSNVVKDTEDQAKFNFDSLCDQTMVGFVQDMSKSGEMETHHITCFYGKVVKDDQQYSLAQKQNEKTTSKRRGKAGNLFMKHVPSEKNDAQIDMVNNGNKTWRANTCMLQKNHPNYNHEECENYCLAE